MPTCYLCTWERPNPGEAPITEISNAIRIAERMAAEQGCPMLVVQAWKDPIYGICKASHWYDEVATQYKESLPNRQPVYHTLGARFSQEDDMTTDSKTPSLDDATSDPEGRYFGPIGACRYVAQTAEIPEQFRMIVLEMLDHAVVLDQSRPGFLGARVEMPTFEPFDLACCYAPVRFFALGIYKKLASDKSCPIHPDARGIDELNLVLRSLKKIGASPPADPTLGLRDVLDVVDGHLRECQELQMDSMILRLESVRESICALASIVKPEEAGRPTPPADAFDKALDQAMRTSAGYYTLSPISEAELADLGRQKEE